MLVLIVLLFTLSWFPFFTVQLYLLTDDNGHRDSALRTTVAVLQLLGYRSAHQSCMSAYHQSVTFMFISRARRIFPA